MAQIEWVGTKQCKVQYVNKDLTPTGQCLNWASPGKSYCKAHRGWNKEAREERKRTQ